MKERRSYLNPDIKVISIRENSDIIQTSGVDLSSTFTNIGNIPDITKATKLYSAGFINGFKGLFNNN